MEVVFPFPQIFKIDLDSTRVDLPMFESKFRSFPAISLLARVGWKGGGGCILYIFLSEKKNCVSVSKQVAFSLTFNKQGTYKLLNLKYMCRKT